PLDMLAELREDNKQLAANMREMHALCDEHDDVASASRLENWIDKAGRGRGGGGACSRTGSMRRSGGRGSCSKRAGAASPARVDRVARAVGRRRDEVGEARPAALGMRNRGGHGYCSIL